MGTILNGRYVSPGQSGYAARIPGYEHMTAAERQAAAGALSRADATQMRMAIVERTGDYAEMRHLIRMSGYDLAERYALVTGRRPLGWKDGNIPAAKPDDVDIATVNMAMTRDRLERNLQSGHFGFTAERSPGAGFERRLAPDGRHHHFSLPNGIASNSRGYVTPEELAAVKKLARADVADATAEQIEAYDRRQRQLDRECRKLVDRATLSAALESLGFQAERIPNRGTSFSRRGTQFILRLCTTLQPSEAERAVWAAGFSVPRAQVIEAYREIERAGSRD